MALSAALCAGGGQHAELGPGKVLARAGPVACSETISPGDAVRLTGASERNAGAREALPGRRSKASCQSRAAHGAPLPCAARADASLRTALMLGPEGLGGQAWAGEVARALWDRGSCSALTWASHGTACAAPTTAASSPGRCSPWGGCCLSVPRAPCQELGPLCPAVCLAAPGLGAGEHRWAGVP